MPLGAPAPDVAHVVPARRRRPEVVDDRLEGVRGRVRRPVVVVTFFVDAAAQGHGRVDVDGRGAPAARPRVPAPDVDEEHLGPRCENLARTCRRRRRRRRRGTRVAGVTPGVAPPAAIDDLGRGRVVRVDQGLHRRPGAHGGRHVEGVPGRDAAPGPGIGLGRLGRLGRRRCPHDRRARAEVAEFPEHGDGVEEEQERLVGVLLPAARPERRHGWVPDDGGEDARRRDDRPGAADVRAPEVLPGRAYPPELRRRCWRTRGHRRLVLLTRTSTGTSTGTSTARRIGHRRRRRRRPLGGLGAGVRVRKRQQELEHRVEVAGVTQILKTDHDHGVCVSV